MNDIAKLREAVAERINALPILQVMGAVVWFQSNGESVVEIDGMKDFHFGGAETRSLNGCVISGLFDAAICAAALVRFPGRRCATRRLSVEFTAPVTGEFVAAFGKIVSIAGQSAACEALLLDSLGTVRASATGEVHIFGKPGQAAEIEGRAWRSA